jgi:hypothetical protein
MSWILAQAETTGEPGLTAAGAVLMFSSIAVVCGLAVFCIYRILREPAPRDRHHVPLDIDTHDVER